MAGANGGSTSGANAFVPVECKEQGDTGVSAEEAKALRYLLRNKLIESLNIKRLDATQQLCIETITAKPERIKLRGETVISYDAIVMFPRGHRTECLGEGSPEAASRRMEQAQQRRGFDFGALNQAAGDCGRLAEQNHAIKPQQPGARIKFLEEDAI